MKAHATSPLAACTGSKRANDASCYTLLPLFVAPPRTHQPFSPGAKSLHSSRAKVTAYSATWFTTSLAQLSHTLLDAARARAQIGSSRFGGTQLPELHHLAPTVAEAAVYLPGSSTERFARPTCPSTRSSPKFVRSAIVVMEVQRDRSMTFDDHSRNDHLCGDHFQYQYTVVGQQPAFFQHRPLYNGPGTSPYHSTHVFQPAKQTSNALRSGLWRPQSSTPQTVLFGAPQQSTYLPMMETQDDDILTTHQPTHQPMPAGPHLGWLDGQQRSLDHSTAGNMGFSAAETVDQRYYKTPVFYHPQPSEYVDDRGESESTTHQTFSTEPDVELIATEADDDLGTNDQCYAKIIYECLRRANDNTLSLKEIYDGVLANSNKVRDVKNQGWKNSVRHNLSMNHVSSMTDPGRVTGLLCQSQANICEGFREDQRRYRLQEVQYVATVAERNRGWTSAVYHAVSQGHCEEASSRWYSIYYQLQAAGVWCQRRESNPRP